MYATCAARVSRTRQPSKFTNLDILERNPINVRLVVKVFSSRLPWTHTGEFILERSHTFVNFVMRNLEQCSTWKNISYRNMSINKIEMQKSENILKLTLGLVSPNILSQSYNATVFLYPTTQICYTLRKFWESVRSSVHPSALRFRTLTWVVFDWFSSNFAWTLISRRSGLGLQMG